MAQDILHRFLQGDAMSKENMQRVLAVVWGNSAPDRYVPRATTPPAWQVWDRKEKRGLTDDEAAALTFENVCERHMDS